MRQLFLNGYFYSMDNQNTEWKAVLVENGIILDTFKQCPTIPDAELVDMKGATIFPGFIDTHTHSFEGGLYSLGANLENVHSIAETLDCLRATPPLGNKVFAFHFDENQIDEKRFPSRHELDTIFPEHAVLLRRVDGHSCVINTAAMQQIPWEKQLPTNFDGMLRGKENDIAAHWFHRTLTNDDYCMAYQQAAKLALQGGHTTVHTMVGDAQGSCTHLPTLLSILDTLPIEYIPYAQSFNINEALELGMPRIGGCILADGSFGSHTAALSEPYLDAPNLKGTLYQSDNFWYGFVKEAHLHNLQIGVHCIGDAAINQILTAYERVQVEYPKDLRHEIIHNELTDDTILNRMAKANVAAVMQPMFDRLWGGEDGYYTKVLGWQRASRTTRLRSIMDRNILLTGGSDWYITELNALMGIQAAASIHYEPERLNLVQALRLYTSNAALLSHDEGRLGQIQKGYQADFSCLDKDPIATNSMEGVQISAVYKKGILRYAPSL